MNTKMGTWSMLKAAIIRRGYSLWQTQYGTYSPNGYIVGFMKGDKRLQVITHNPKIEQDIRKSSLP